MTSRERVYSSLKFQKTDRVPRFVWFGAETAKMLSNKLGITPLELELKFKNDVLQTWVSINGEMSREVPDNSIFVDEWGITWKRQGYYNMVIEHPLRNKDISFIKDYKLPDPHKPERFNQLEYLKQNYGHEYFIGADVSGVLFEPAYHLRNLEDLMIDMAEENEQIEIILNKLSEFSIAVSKECIDRGADWIWMGDDLGSQNGMLMSPLMWRKYFKPRMKYIIDSLRTYKKDVIIAYHSCGSIHPVINDLVELGLNVLNPIQESAKDMNQLEIKKEFGEKITLMCGLDTQQFLVTASPEEVREKTREIVEKLNFNGGMIFAASHHIQPDTPEENIYAMFEALDNI